MIFSFFKEFRRDSSTLGDVVQYLRSDLTEILRDLTTGLERLEFKDNFRSFTKEIEDLAPGEEISIVNEIKTSQRNFVQPTAWIITRKTAGAESIVEGDTEWSNEKLYLKNTGTSPATFTVLFLK